jgi:hypothetical protein
MTRECFEKQMDRPPDRERRTRSDRRVKLLSALWHGSFRRRRLAPRRIEDGGLAAVDWHRPQWMAVALLILLFSFADALLTLELLRHGAYEANPLLARLLQSGGLSFAATKIGLTGAGVLILTVLAHARAFGRRVPVSFVLYAVLAGYAALIGYELWLIERISSLPELNVH